MSPDPLDIQAGGASGAMDTAVLASARTALGGHAAKPLLEHLERRFLRHALPPSASDAELRHLEGQRSVILYLNHLVATARRGASGDLPR